MAVDLVHLDAGSATGPLPDRIHPWLRAVVILAFISFFASISLLGVLTYKLVCWQIKSKRSNQFVLLIFNLLLADTQQALAFLLNVEWLRLSAVVVDSPVCKAQGWVVSTGDLGSGVWCFAIGLHTFASVILDFRLKPRAFYSAVVALWVFIIVTSTIPVAMHGAGIYVRSGVWCWLHHDFKSLRLWTHYFWIFIFEFGNIFIYLIIYTLLLHRLHTSYYTPAQSTHVRAIANLMVVYPAVYIICTIPLASARMGAMTGRDAPSLERLCLAGAMITSNGWLDVLLYTATRRIMIFADAPPDEDNGVDTFAAFWEVKSRFGAECTVVANGGDGGGGEREGRGRNRARYNGGGESVDELCVGDRDIKMVVTAQVVSEPAQPEDFVEMGGGRPRSPVSQWSGESVKG